MGREYSAGEGGLLAMGSAGWRRVRDGGGAFGCVRW